MSFLKQEAFQKKFVSALNSNPEFSEQTQWFDGAIQLEVGADLLWLKIYRGKVIDCQATTPPFGYTFKLCGSEASWQLLTNGERRWADLTFPGKRYFDDDPELRTAGSMQVEIRTEGNLLEAGRMTEAIFLLAYTLKESV